MYIYIGEKRGVYPQGIVAVSESVEEALALTKKEMYDEHDSYHTFHVFRLMLGEGGPDRIDIYSLGWNRSFGMYNSLDVNSPPIIMVSRG